MIRDTVIWNSPCGRGSFIKAIPGHSTRQGRGSGSWIRVWWSDPDLYFELGLIRIRIKQLDILISNFTFDIILTVWKQKIKIIIRFFRETGFGLILRFGAEYSFPERFDPGFFFNGWFGSGSFPHGSVTLLPGCRTRGASTELRFGARVLALLMYIVYNLHRYNFFEPQPLL